MLTALVACSAMLVNAQQIILTQDFESGSLPSGWSRTQDSPSVGWEFGAVSSLTSTYFSIPAGTKIAASNDDAHDNQGATANLADADRLITPSFNLTSVSAARLTFSSYFTGEYGSSGSIQISVNGGSWVTLKNLPGDGVWTTEDVDLTAYVGQSNLKIAFLHNDGGGWASGFAIDDVSIYEPVPIDAAITGINLTGTLQRGFHTLTATIANKGVNTITSFEISYSIDNAVTWQTQTVTGLNLTSNTSTDVDFTDKVALRDAKNYTFLVKVKMPNNSTDPITNNDQVTVPVSVLVGHTDRKVLIEEATGAWCQFCPDGAVKVDELLTNYPNDVVATSLHDGDGMANTFSDALNNAFAGGSYPSGEVDRVLFSGESNVGSNRGTWEAHALERMDIERPVNLAASNTYNPSTRDLTVDVTATFLADYADNYRLSVMVVEDSVVGPNNSQYNQVNYYNSVSGHTYYQAGNPIHYFPHMQVLREILGGTWGQSGSIPNPITALTPYSYQFTTTLDNSYRDNKVFLIVVAQHYGNSTGDRNIINAMRLDLNSADTLAMSTSVSALVSGVTDPACGSASSGEITMDVIGEGPFTYAWSNTYGYTGTSLSGLSAGTYTITTTDTYGNTATNTATLTSPLNATLAYNVPSTGATDGDITVTVTGGSAPYTYTWSNGGAGASQADLAAGLYEVTVTDNSGCSDVLKIALGVSVGITTPVATNVKMNLYPNPTTGIVNYNATINRAVPVTIEVFNSLGEILVQKDLGNLSNTTGQLDLSAYSKGMYFVRLTAGDEVKTDRFVIER